MFISLVEECHLEGICRLFEKLYMNHKELLEMKWEKNDVDWFILEHIRRG
jgi:hypothetical protein